MKASGKYKAAGDGWIESIQAVGYADSKDESEYQDWLRGIVAACIDHCSGTVWVNHKTRFRDGIAIHPVTMLPFPMWADIIWSRPGSMTLNAGRFAPSHEYILGFGKPAHWEDRLKTMFTVWSIQPRSERGHPCAYPIEIPRTLIEATCPKDGTTLDPFMGSGTTVLAAMDLGRKSIGIEIEPRYFDIACERVAAAQSQLRICP
jgi:hypothetical protein